MKPFQEKAVGATNTLGERFRQLREEAGMSLEVAADRTRVNIKHLQAIENGRYAELPGPIYAKSFVRSYARLLEVSEQTALSMFEREYAVAANLTPSRPAFPPRPARLAALVTPHGIRRAIILLLTLGVVVYLAVEIRNLTSAPALVITSPPAQSTTSLRTVELTGTTEPEANVTANGKIVLVDRRGHFREVLDLQDGLNTLIIQATKKRGKTTTVVRKILVESPR